MSMEFRAFLNASGLGAFRTLIGAGGRAQCRDRVLVPTVSGAGTHRIRCWYPPYQVLIPTVSGAGTHRIRCWYPPYQVLIPTVSGADTCPSHARSQLGPLRPLQRRDSAFCRLRVGHQALWVSASAPWLVYNIKQLDICCYAVMVALMVSDQGPFSLLPLIHRSM